MQVREFSIEEANATVEELADVVATQLELGDQIADLVRALGEHAPQARRPMDADEDEDLDEGVEAVIVDITIAPSDGAYVRQIKRSLADCVKQYRAGWQRVEESGAVVADTASGQLDFVGRVDGRRVWLCWTFGEEGIEHYRELDEELPMRHPLAPVRRRHLN